MVQFLGMKREKYMSKYDAKLKCYGFLMMIVQYILINLWPPSVTSICYINQESPMLPFTMKNMHKVFAHVSN